MDRIALFDSGVGGLTVMKEVMRVLPHEDLIYFGDTARVPYGGKSSETIIRYAIESAIFLMQQQIKMLVIPCNTVSAYALDKLREIFKIPILGVIEPGVAKVIETTRGGRIAVLGTKATIQSGSYPAQIQRQLPHAFVSSIACPLFVPLVEEMFLSHAATKLIVQEYLKPLQEQKIDTLLLGCTHYPLLKHLIQEEVGPSVTIVDSATTCADTVAAMLQKQKLLRKPKKPGQHKFFVSDDPKKFQLLGQTFLGMPIEQVESISLAY